MAALLGMDHSTYVFYERPSRFKKARLPIDMTRRIAGVLADRGVPSEEVMALAGVGDDDGVELGLTPSQEKWLDLHDALAPVQRHLIQQLAEQLLGRGPADVLNQPQEDFRARASQHRGQEGARDA